MDERKEYDCGLIQDLLPLYQDDVCSDVSRKAVEEHLAGCKNCRVVADKLKNTKVDDRLILEKNGVLKEHAKRERRKTITVGIGMAGILMIPVIVCLICNLAIGHGLDWFFIVLTALLLTASLTVLPMLVQENRLLWTLGGFVISLILLLFVICIYTGGDWFLLAVIPTIFGLSVLFMPYVIRKIHLPNVLAHSKTLIVIFWDTIWLYAVIVICGFYVKNPYEYWEISLKITTFCMIYLWAIVLLIRYLKVNGWIKAGVSMVITGISVSLVNDVIHYITDGKWHMVLSDADFSCWSSNVANVNVVDANIKLIILIAFAGAGILLAVVGIVKMCVNREK